MGFGSTVRICLQPEHLRSTVLITVVVGTWLTLFNQIDAVLGGSIDLWLATKVALNYATPFVVANAGLLCRRDEE